MQIQHFYDADTFTLTYVVYDGATRDAVVIDPVLDYDPAASRVGTRSLERLAGWIRGLGLRVHYSLETHAHADHLSGGQWLRERLGAKVATGERVTIVQRAFKAIYGLGDGFAIDGSQFDRLLSDGEALEAGALRVDVLATPGHTPGCVTYAVGDAGARALFVGDALFMEDYGTARCDFPGGDASALYDSLMRLYSMDGTTRVLPAHDYQPGGRALRWETTIEAERTSNVQLRATTSRDEFVRFRKERDATLSSPRLLWPSVQVNIDAGRLPALEPSGRRFLRVPIDASALG